MSDSDNEVYQLYRAGISYADIARLKGWTESGVRGMVSRARNNYRNVIRLDSTKLPVSNVTPLAALDDTQRWQNALDALALRNRYIAVVHLCDIHFPFHDETVMNADYHLVQLLQPDVIVRGSDEDDNPTISRYIEDGSEEPDIGDFLDVMQSYRQAHTDRLKAVAPGALQVNIEGNHGWPRFEKWINKRAKASKVSLQRRYIENVRCNGDVYWIGPLQSVVIHGLLVEHGKFYNKHTAQKNMDHRRYRYRGQMSGHTHRPQMVVLGNNVSAVSGCRCILPEYYGDDEGDGHTNHAHSATYATIDTVDGSVDIKQVLYHKRDDGSVWFEHGGKVYDIDAVSPIGNMRIAV